MHQPVLLGDRLHAPHAVDALRRREPPLPPVLRARLPVVGRDDQRWSASEHALVALRVCRNELTKACDWLFKHKYAGDLDQVVRAFDKGDYDDERWNEEQFHAPKDAWVDEPGLPRAGDRVPGKGVQHPHDYDADKKGVAL